MTNKSQIIEDECPSCYGDGETGIECCNGNRCSCNGGLVYMLCRVCKGTGRITKESNLMANCDFISGNNLMYLGKNLGGR